MLSRLMISFAFLMLLVACGATSTPAAIGQGTQASISPTPPLVLTAAFATSPAISFPTAQTAATTPGPSAILNPAGTLSVSPTPTNPPGDFVFAPGDGSVWLYDLTLHKSHNLFKPTPTLFASAPAFTPDGKSVLFVLTTLDSANQGHDSLQLIGTDGQDQHVLYQPDDPRISLNFPTYTEDGAWIYLTANLPLADGSRRTDIQRISGQGGTPQPIFQDARQPSLSPDAKHLAFIRFNEKQFSASLWVANGDGSSFKMILSDDVFVSIQAPRISPDGQTIVFAASGPNAKPLPGVTSDRECQPILLCVISGRAYAATDGLPWELWSVDLGGKKFTQLTHIAADSPYPAWSRDGSQIAYMDTMGLYVLDVTKNKVTQVSASGAHGVFDWWQP